MVSRRWSGILFRISWSPMEMERSNDLSKKTVYGKAGTTVTPAKGWRKWRRREVSLTAITCGVYSRAYVVAFTPLETERKSASETVRLKRNLGRVEGKKQRRERN